jgi:very-short-patch-repair endonuclease
VTTPECTIVDMAASRSRDEVEEMISQAVIRRLTTEAKLRGAAGVAGRRPGAPQLRRIMDIRTFRFTRSGAERAFIPIALRAGLGMPLVNHVVHGYEVDFYFPDIGLVVEIDGFTYHQTAAQRAKDLERDQVLTALDLKCCRFSAGQIRYESERVEEVLRSLAARLRR